jgi:hypothetical protein
MDRQLLEIPDLLLRWEQNNATLLKTYNIQICPAYLNHKFTFSLIAES